MVTIHSPVNIGDPWARKNGPNSSEANPVTAPDGLGAKVR